MNPHPSFSLEGKRIIVTGAGQGIGYALSSAIVSLGGSVVAVDLNASGLDRLVDEHGAGRVATVAGNVTDPAVVQNAMEAGTAAFGGLDGLVNNAGVTRTAMLDKMELGAWQQVLDVHLTASFMFLQALARQLIERSKAGQAVAGSIVNISSDAGRRGTLGQINYGTAKAGVLGMTMCAARELARYNVRVNTVGFGVVETPMTETIRGEKFRDIYLQQIPLGRWGEPQEVVRPVCFLLSDGASYVTGQHLSVNGGYTIGLWARRGGCDGACAVLEVPMGGAADDYFWADELFVSTARSQAALAHGSRDNGAPGERPYHPGYYAAFVLDPDGNNIEAVYHGEATRSAPSVRITF